MDQNERTELKVVIHGLRGLIIGIETLVHNLESLTKEPPQFQPVYTEEQLKQAMGRVEYNPTPTPTPTPAPDQTAVLMFTQSSGGEGVSIEPPPTKEEIDIVKAHKKAVTTITKEQLEAITKHNPVMAKLLKQKPKRK